MAKVTIEIEDDLEERVGYVKEEIRNDFIDYLEENPDIQDFDKYYQDQGCDLVHESADSNAPIYHNQIDGLYYLYGDEFDEAYENTGMSITEESNYRQVAIYCYLSEKGFDYLRELEDLFNDRDNIKSLIKEMKE